MNNKILFILWGAGLALCAGLGFIPEPQGALAILMTILAVASFIPPALLIVRSGKGNDRRTLTLIRNLAVAALVLTLVLLISNFAAFAASETVGNILYFMLIVVSSPMVCCRYWALSLFLWACIMVTAAAALKKK